MAAAFRYNIRTQYAAWVAVCVLATVIVMTCLHLVVQVRSARRNQLQRAEIAARTLAQAAASALSSNATEQLPAVVGRAVPDGEVVYLRILNARDELVYRPSMEHPPTGLLLRRPVQWGDERVGTVEIGMGQVASSAALVRLVFLDLGIGLLLLVGAVAASLLASQPVRESLQQLRDYVERFSAGGDARERLTSELAEVDEIGSLLRQLMRKVEVSQQWQARAQEELKAAQKEMDEYTYFISHDLKEPLRGIEAFSRFLVEGYRDRLDEEGQHRIDVIRKSALRMQHLISDLLKFSRLGQQKNPLVPVGLNAMLMHVRVNLQYALDAKKVDLRVDRLPTVVCDPTAMTEVFHNLISNSIKYNDKPHPVVEVSCVENPHPQTGAPEYEFCVRDNGIGIKPEFHEKIFQIFQRLHRDDEGTGIGLTIVKRVIAWHGGRIWVESEPGQGTAFFFALPRREVSKKGTILEPSTTTAKGVINVAHTV